MNQKLEAYYGGRLLESLKDFFFLREKTFDDIPGDCAERSSYLLQPYSSVLPKHMLQESTFGLRPLSSWTSSLWTLSTNTGATRSPSTRKKSPQWPRFLVLAHASSCFGFSR